jgi:hypothetical protein
MSVRLGLYNYGDLSHKLALRVALDPPTLKRHARQKGAPGNSR